MVFLHDSGKFVLVALATRKCHSIGQSGGYLHVFCFHMLTRVDSGG